MVSIAMTERTTHFTADTHFFDGRPGVVGRRPFPDVETMNATIVRNWNDLVTPDDVVWHVGDFSATDDEAAARKVFLALNGTKHLVLGNHDEGRRATLLLPWASVSTRAYVDDGNGGIFLCHYPMRTWPGSRRGAVHGFGHMHGYLEGYRDSLDVGVDAWDYRPATLSEIRARLSTLPPDPLFEDPEPSDAPAP